MGHNLVQNPIHIFVTLSDSQSADRIARKVQLRNPLRVLYPHISKDSSLIDTEKQLPPVQRSLFLIQALHLLLTTDKPARCSLHGRHDIIPLGKSGGTLIKSHSDGGSQVRLNLHRLFRSHEDLSAVDMGAKLYALFPNLPAGLCQTVDLESAGIRKNRFIPIHETVQTAKFFDDLVPSTNMKMIGIGEFHLCSDAS